jgi:hypothetical protein
MSNTAFFFGLKFREFRVLSCADYKMLPKMYHHPLFYTENYVCDVGINKKMCNNSETFSLESGKRTDIG